MKVQFAGRKGEATASEGRTPFETVLRTSDVLTLHCPLTAETRGLISEPEYGQMTRRPLVINTTRGGVVDEDALVRAQDTGLIAGAGFDVLTSEPPAADHPLLRAIGRPNFILTPHVAWASREAMQALADQLVENLDAFATGTPRNRVA